MKEEEILKTYGKSEIHYASFVIYIDIDKLIKLSKNLDIRRILISKLDQDSIKRTRKSGFSKNRYQKTEIKYPILIDRMGCVLNGRHRVCKLIDYGKKYVNVKVIPNYMIEACIINGKEPIFT